MGPLSVLLLAAAATSAAPAEPVPASRGARVTAQGQAVAVILPVATNEAEGGAGAVHRRIARDGRGVSAVYE